MTGEQAKNRTVFAITGQDRVSFLQGLVSNDVLKLEAKGIVYAALLTPQGKYLADFFLVARGDSILLDIATPLADDTLRRLTMYRLRADVRIEQAAMNVQRGLGVPPEGALADPRHASLGWRQYGVAAGAEPTIDWDALRVAACIPESCIELIPDETFILEAGFDRLNGVDFRKGCYVGQEVTARMRHKTELRKGLITVAVEGSAPVGTTIRAGEKEAGVLYTQSGGQGIAHLRFDRITDRMSAGDALVRSLPA